MLYVEVILFCIQANVPGFSVFDLYWEYLTSFNARSIHYVMFTSVLMFTCTFRLEDSESEGTTKSEDSSEQPSKVIENITNAVTEGAENSGMLQFRGFRGLLNALYLVFTVEIPSLPCSICF